MFPNFTLCKQKHRQVTSVLLFFFALFVTSLGKEGMTTT